MTECIPCYWRDRQIGREREVEELNRKRLFLLHRTELCTELQVRTCRINNRTQSEQESGAFQSFPLASKCAISYLISNTSCKLRCLSAL